MIKSLLKRITLAWRQLTAKEKSIDDLLTDLSLKMRKFIDSPELEKLLTPPQDLAAKIKQVHDQKSADALMPEYSAHSQKAVDKFVNKLNEITIEHMPSLLLLEPKHFNIYLGTVDTIMASSLPVLLNSIQSVLQKLVPPLQKKEPEPTEHTLTEITEPFTMSKFDA